MTSSRNAQVKENIWTSIDILHDVMRVYRSKFSYLCSMSWLRPKILPCISSNTPADLGIRGSHLHVKLLYRDPQLNEFGQRGWVTEERNLMYSFE